MIDKCKKFLCVKHMLETVNLVTILQDAQAVKINTKSEKEQPALTTKQTKSLSSK